MRNSENARYLCSSKYALLICAHEASCQYTDCHHATHEDMYQRTNNELEAIEVNKRINNKKNRDIVA